MPSVRRLAIVIILNDIRVKKGELSLHKGRVR